MQTANGRKHRCPVQPGREAAAAGVTQPHKWAAERRCSGRYDRKTTDAVTGHGGKAGLQAALSTSCDSEWQVELMLKCWGFFFFYFFLIFPFETLLRLLLCLQCCCTVILLCQHLVSTHSSFRWGGGVSSVTAARWDRRMDNEIHLVCTHNFPPWAPSINKTFSLFFLSSGV